MLQYKLSEMRCIVFIHNYSCERSWSYIVRFYLFIYVTAYNYSCVCFLSVKHNQITSYIKIVSRVFILIAMVHLESLLVR